MSERDSMADEASRIGLWLATYSPGDGQTRWRFGRKADQLVAVDGHPSRDCAPIRNPGYFGMSGCYTALGRKEAKAFLAGAAIGYGNGYDA